MLRQLPHLAMKKLKLLHRLTNSPQSATFADLRALLLLEGFELERITGSHHIFKRGGVRFVIPVHANRVKSVYVKQVIALIQQSKGIPK